MFLWPRLRVALTCEYKQKYLEDSLTTIPFRKPAVVGVSPPVHPQGQWSLEPQSWPGLQYQASSSSKTKLKATGYPVILVPWLHQRPTLPRRQIFKNLFCFEIISHKRSLLASSFLFPLPSLLLTSFFLYHNTDILSQHGLHLKLLMFDTFSWSEAAKERLWPSVP